jgi:hypothetical protein
MSGMRYQPQGQQRIDWSNPITRGLATAINAAHPLLNLVDNDPVLPSHGPNDTFRRKVNTRGKALATYPSANVSIYLNKLHDCLNGATTFILLTPREFITNNDLYTAIVSHRDSSGWAMASIVLGDGTNPRFSGWTSRADYGPPRLSTTWDYELGKTYAIAYSSASAKQILTVNGKVEGRAAWVIGNQQYLRGVGSGSPSYTDGSMEFNLILHWNRDLSEEETISITNNPWQIFQKSSNESVYNLQTVGGGGPIVNGDVSLIGLSSSTIIRNLAASGNAQKLLTKVNVSSNITLPVLFGLANKAVTGISVITARGATYATAVASKGITGTPVVTAIGVTYVVSTVNKAITGVSVVTARGITYTTATANKSITGISAVTARGTTYAAVAVNKNIIGISAVTARGTTYVISTVNKTVASVAITSAIHAPTISSNTNTIASLSGVSSYLTLRTVTNYAFVNKLLNKVDGTFVIRPTTGSGSSVKTMSGLQSNAASRNTSNSGTSLVNVGALQITSFIGSLSINGQSQANVNVTGVPAVMVLGTVNLLTNSTMTFVGLNNSLMVRQPILSGSAIKVAQGQTSYAIVGPLASTGTAVMLMQRIPVFFGNGNVIAFTGSGVSASVLTPSIYSKMELGVVLGRIRNQKSSFGYTYARKKIPFGLIINRQ